MATIDPNGVLIYQDTDNYTPIQTALNLAQSNLSSLLGANAQIVKVSSVGDRNAKAAARGGISKANPFVAWRADAADGLQLEYTTNGTSWVVYNNADSGDLALTMSNGFTGAVGGGWVGVTIRRTRNIVLVNGLFTRDSGWSAGTPIGTVPPGWAPPRREKGNGADVLADGTVVADAAGAANDLVSCKVVYAVS